MTQFTKTIAAFIFGVSFMIPMPLIKLTMGVSRKEKQLHWSARR